jgi:hypothetical protein
MKKELRGFTKFFEEAKHILDEKSEALLSKVHVVVVQFMICMTRLRMPIGKKLKLSDKEKFNH